MQTRLAYLMKKMEVTARELSAGTGVDVSMLSKLKNGHRKLTLRSKYPTLFYDFFINCEVEKQRNFLRELLFSYNPHVNPDSHSQMAKTFALWLTSEDDSLGFLPKTASITTQKVEIYNSPQKLVEGMKALCEHALRLTPGKNLYFVDYTEDVTPQNFPLIESCLPEIERLSDYGHNVSILDGRANKVKAFVSVFNWFNSYLANNTEVSMNNSKRDMRIAYAVVEGECAYLALGNDRDIERVQGVLFYDKSSVDFFVAQAKSDLASGRKMLRKIPATDIRGMLKVLDNYLRPKQMTYLVNPTMMYKTMDITTLEDILRNNDVTGKAKDLCIYHNRVTAEVLRPRCPYKQIYDLDAMMKQASKEYTIDEEMSLTCGKPIRVTKNQLYEHLKFLSSINDPEMYQVLFVPFERLHVLRTNIHFVVQDNSVVLAWDVLQSENRMYSNEVPVIEGFSRYAEEVWRAIPDMCADPYWQKKQVAAMMEMLKLTNN